MILIFSILSFFFRQIFENGNNQADLPSSKSRPFMNPLKSWTPLLCRHRFHLAGMLKHHHHHHHLQTCRRKNATGATSRSTALRPGRSDWNTSATAKSRKVNVEVGKLLVYVLLIFLTIWNSVIFRWWQPSPKQGGTSHEISLNCACFVIFI